MMREQEEKMRSSQKQRLSTLGSTHNLSDAKTTMASDELKDSVKDSNVKLKAS